MDKNKLEHVVSIRLTNNEYKALDNLSKKESRDIRNQIQLEVKNALLKYGLLEQEGGSTSVSISSE